MSIRASIVATGLAAFVLAITACSAGNQTDTTVPSTAQPDFDWLLVHSNLGDAPEVLVVVDDQAVLSIRERDFVSAEHLPIAAGHDLLAVVTRGGGPGTCVWFQQLTLYEVDPDLGLISHAETSIGDYLTCVEGPRSCGCGTWEADWQIDARDDGALMLTTSPMVTHKEDLPFVEPHPKTVEIHL